jgi:hypothetical protein
VSLVFWSFEDQRLINQNSGTSSSAKGTATEAEAGIGQQAAKDAGRLGKEAEKKEKAEKKKK